MNKQYMVREFMQAAGQDTPDEPTQPGKHINILRLKLILEEAREFGEAVGLQFDLIPVYEKGELVDHVKVADAIADLLYVVYGAAVAYGIQIDPVFGEVHRSNMSKFIDGHRREDGKWVKGPSYSPARIKEVLDAQRDVNAVFGT